jgi:hypothetical protein
MGYFFVRWDPCPLIELLGLCANSSIKRASLLTPGLITEGFGQPRSCASSTRQTLRATRSAAWLLVPFTQCLHAKRCSPQRPSLNSWYWCGLNLTLKGVATVLPTRNPFRVCVSCGWDPSFPGLPRRNPGLELANAFSVTFRLHQYRRLVHKTCRPWVRPSGSRAGLRTWG